MESQQAGKYIKALRQRLSLTQTEFAHSIGIKQAYLSYMEKGKRPVLTIHSNTIARKYKRSIAKEINYLSEQLAYLKSLR